MNTRAPFLLILVLFTALLLPLFTGCGGIRNDYAEKQIFRLSASPDAADLQAQDKGSKLLVKGLDISPEFSGAAFVYRLGQNRYAQDYYHNYMTPPARMITDLVMENLYASSYFSPASKSIMAETNYQLWGKITGLYCDIKDDKQAVAVITIRLNLDKQTTGGSEPLLSQTYEAAIPMEKTSPDEYVKGLNQGLTHILNAFFTDVSKLDLT
ncbi:MAG: PqiC family protein [Desulfobacterales bacterium]|nr:PqiC family protein [Desulfobacterales bacterium]